KVLTLFFVDRVANYAPPDGLICRLFDEEFTRAKRGRSGWSRLTANDVGVSYFAERRRVGAGVEAVDSSGKSKEDDEAYRLIMQDKERLLSFAEPRCFIFSHSALREGWDSPNVFQVCTLNETHSEMKKRQE